MKFPYGLSDFRQMITEDYFYCDRTDRIPLIENTGKYLLFLRPRRFGKSLLLSMLENYYDVARKEQFEELFGHLLIAENPTSLHNRYFILKWDFSCADPSGTAEDMKKSLHNHLNASVRSFIAKYEDLQLPGILIDPDDALSSVRSLLDAAHKTPWSVYLLIDEYDNFANEVMMGRHRCRKDSYDRLVYEEGPLKTVFKAVKAFAGSSGFDRIFITGVSPVVMSDITSGYNIAENIYLHPEFNDLCGFTEGETEDIIKKIMRKCGREGNGSDAVDLMRIYYNGYVFSTESEQPVYNPTLALYFMKIFYATCNFPKKMLDANLAADEEKLCYVSQVPAGKQILFALIEDKELLIPDLADRFGIRQMLTGQSKDKGFMASFLYYFGVLTMNGETAQGKLRLKVPNLVIRGLYIERIRHILLPMPADRDEGISAAEQLYQNGNIKPLCDFVEQKFFRVFHNRDYRWANELTVKTAFLTLLYNDILYIMDSEKSLNHGYADLTMIIRPDMRRFELFDILIEFKYVSLKEVGLTGEDSRELSSESLRNIPAVQLKTEEAGKQVIKYGKSLREKYGNLRLKQYAVISIGFERLCWKPFAD